MTPAPAGPQSPQMPHAVPSGSLIYVRKPAGAVTAKDAS